MPSFNDIIKGLEEVDSLEGRLANMIDSGTEEGRKAKDVIAVMKAILSNAIQWKELGGVGGVE